MTTVEHDLLVAAAHRVELEPLCSRLGGRAATLEGGLRVSSVEVGVGLAAAGPGLALALARQPAHAVLVVGSFGAYPGSDVGPGALCAPQDVRLIDGGLLQARAAAPAVMRTRAAADPGLRAGLLAAEPAACGGTLATTAFITTDDDLARTLGQSGCLGENLELLSMALACEAHGVRWAAALACTNVVGSQGRAQWLAGHAHAAEQTAATVLRFLALGAPGLR